MKGHLRICGKRDTLHAPIHAQGTVGPDRSGDVSSLGMSVGARMKMSASWLEKLLGYYDRRAITVFRVSVLCAWDPAAAFQYQMPRPIGTVSPLNVERKLVSMGCAGTLVISSITDTHRHISRVAQAK